MNSTAKADPDFSIYTVHHKHDLLLPDFKKLFKPVQGGAAHAKTDLGILKDNDGPNISDRNKNFSELSVIYWLSQQPCSDYVGLMHYRRFFVPPCPERERRYVVKFWRRAILHKIGLRKRGAIGWRYIHCSDANRARKDAASLVPYLKEHLADYDAVLPTRTWISGMDMREQYAADHYVRDYDMFFEIMSELHPELRPSIEKLPHYKNLHFMNMFIFRREMFLDYSDKLFSTLFEMEKRIDLSGYNSYQARIYGFLSERFMGLYVDYLRSKGEFKLLELPVVFYNGPQPGDTYQVA